jgi:hypothetical protein
MPSSPEHTLDPIEREHHSSDKGKMSETAGPLAQWGPDWVLAEMPPGYQNRVAEIRRLSADLEAMGRFGHLLFAIGPQLSDVIHSLFETLNFEVERIPDPASSTIAARLSGGRRLLLHVSATNETIQKKSPDLAHVFQLLHGLAEEGDRVVLVANTEPDVRPENRALSITPEALTFLGRMGAAYLPAPTLFTLWKVWLQEPDRARSHVERLHAQDGGTFQLSLP